MRNAIGISFLMQLLNHCYIFKRRRSGLLFDERLLIRDFSKLSVQNRKKANLQNNTIHEAAFLILLTQIKGWGVKFYAK